MNEWTKEGMSELVNKWTINVRMKERTNEEVDEWMNEWISQLVGFQVESLELLQSSERPGVDQRQSVACQVQLGEVDQAGEDVLSESFQMISFQAKNSRRRRAAKHRAM